MQDLFPQLEAWQAEGRRVALATVIRVERSAPRPPGTAMAVNDRGEVAGSVSGGCVEGALYEEMQAVLDEGRARVVSYGIADDDAFAVGLSCGGTIHVYVEPFSPLARHFPALATAVRTGRPVALATAVGGKRLGAKWVVTAGDVLGGTGEAELDNRVAAAARALLRQGETELLQLPLDAPGAELEVFVQCFTPPPRLFVFGAVNFAAAMVRVGKFLGYRVTLCDARPVFATRERFPEADEIVVAWPHEYLRQTEVGPRDAVVVLTHDPKFDVPVLTVALQTEAAYIGALGSRTTHARRVEQLLAAGVAAEDLERIAAPAGLDLGGRTPEETALAIAAEMTALRHGRTGGRLKERAAAPRADVAASGTL